MGLLGDHTATSGLDWNLPAQSNRYDSPYSLSRHNQLRAVAAAGLDAAIGRGVIAGGAVVAGTGLAVEVAAGTVLFVGGLAWELPSAFVIGALINGTPQLNYIWATIRRLQTADYDERAEVDTYELEIEITLTDAAPNALDDWFQLAVATANAGAITAVAEPTDLSKKYARHRQHQLAATLDHKDGSVTDPKLAIPYVKADGTRPFTGDQSMGGNQLTNVGTPGAAADAATKDYVDVATAGSGAALTTHKTTTPIDHPDGSVTATKLAASVQDRVGTTVAASTSAEVADVITVTLQARDLANNDLLERRLIRVWLADTQWGPPTATMPSGGVAVSGAIGTAIRAVAASDTGLYLTGADGWIGLEITETTNKTFWLHAEVEGKVVALEVDFN